tara:strand:- start:1169 stop:1402 length:234 start_codon:yes stop_codon:yes gene_type:complete
MKITMTQTMSGSANQLGNASMQYEAGETYDMTMPWQIELADVFVSNGWASEKGRKKQTKVDAPSEAKSKGRAKKAKR